WSQISPNLCSWVQAMKELNHSSLWIYGSMDPALEEAVTVGRPIPIHGIPLYRVDLDRIPFTPCPHEDEFALKIRSDCHAFGADSHDLRRICGLVRTAGE